MSEINKRYQKILEEVKNKIKDEKELEFINKKIAEVSVIFLDMIDEMSENFETRLHQLEEQQVFVEGKLKNIQTVVKNIESDIYDEDYKFDILCPYCNMEFSANVENDSQKEVKCPGCNNIIELDWNDESDNCGCSSCSCDDCDDDCHCGNCDHEDDCDYEDYSYEHECDCNDNCERREDYKEDEE